MSKKRRSIVTTACLALVIGMVPASASHDETARVSVATGGGQATGANSFLPAISADGNHVAFSSAATNLVAGDTNGATDVFVHHRRTNTTTRVSVATGGGQAGGGFSQMPDISGDGRYIVFFSDATNLVTGDTNGALDVFVHDHQTNTTTRVSVATGGGQASGGDSHSPAISGDGRYVVFLSDATNLVTGDTNGTTDVFVHDRQTNTTTRVAATEQGQPGDLDRRPALSADGRFIAFTSPADFLVSGDTNGAWDVFVHDRTNGTTTRVSVAGGGGQATGGDSRAPAISGDGRYVTFGSDATNIVFGDTNGTSDVFIHDSQTIETYRVSVPTGGGQATGHSVTPTVSDDGRYVAFTSYAADLVSGDTNGVGDAFVHDTWKLVTTLASVGLGGDPADGSVTSVVGLSEDGRYIAFASAATNMVVDDTNGTHDVFVRHIDRPGALRLSGPNRYATAVAVSREAYPFGADTVYVAVGTNFPDALAAGPAAGVRNAPLLLVQTDSIPSDTAAELIRLAPSAIIVVGGPGVISASVESQLGAYTDTVTRIAGTNRYGTAAAIAAHTWSRPGAPTIFVAVGDNFPDALAAGPAAARAEAPLLLVQTDAIPPETANELARHSPSQIVIVGGTGVISPSVESELGSYADTVTRLAGTNRYGTAAAIVADSWPGTADTVYIAVGNNFPDALGAGPVAAHRDGPLLLVQTDSVPPETIAQLDRLQPSRIVIAGGTGVISVAVEVALAGYVP